LSTPTRGYTKSNFVSALLQGSPGIPSLTSINGVELAATSSDPRYAANNVETVVKPGTVVTLGGKFFDSSMVAVNLFCACPGGKVGPFYVSGSDLTPTSISFVLPASGSNAPSTGPGSFVVINSGGGSFAFASNAVSVPIGEALTVTSVTQTGDSITVAGSGFSSLSVINFFNQQGTATVNLGGLGSMGAPKIKLSLLGSDQFTFTRPSGAVAGPAYVQVVDPPFVPFASSGGGPGGAFTLK
jgi:hypothetical protein